MASHIQFLIREACSNPTSASVVFPDFPSNLKTYGITPDLEGWVGLCRDRKRDRQLASSGVEGPFASDMMEDCSWSSCHVSERALVVCSELCALRPPMTSPSEHIRQEHPDINEILTIRGLCYIIDRHPYSLESRMLMFRETTQYKT